MQTKYVVLEPNETLDDVILSSQKVIESAKTRGDYIIFLQFKGQGPTINELRSLTKGYKDRNTVLKHGVNGSKAIFRGLNFLDIVPLSFTVIGLYSGECVRETINGLLKIYGKPIEVIKSACYSWWDGFTFSRKDKVYGNILVKLT